MEPETMRHPVAYLRRSRVDARRPGIVSHEEQLSAIREYAAKHGDADLLVIEDWGKSGRDEKLRHRDGFARLRSMVKAGEVTAVYAYDLSRLGRSVVTLYQLMTECRDRGVPIRCTTGYSPDISTAEGRLVFGNLSTMFQYLAESVQERAAKRVVERRARGDDLGPAPYGWRSARGRHVPNPAEDVSVLIDAYRMAGGVEAACRLLNDPESGYRAPTRKGGPWRPHTLSQILDVAGVRDRRPRRGRPTSRTFLLSGLLRCPHDDAVLVGHDDHRTGHVGYECRRGRFEHGHPRPLWAPESAMVSWVQDEAARLSIPDTDPGETEPEPVQTAEDLAARRRRVIDLYKSGLIEKDERDADLAQIAADLEAIDQPAPVLDFEAGVVWDDTVPVETRNAQLRALWERIDLGPDMRPTVALWRVPEWRKDDD